MGERVREVPEGPAAIAQLSLELRAEDARLHARQARDLVDLQHAVEPVEIERDHRSLLVGLGAEAAGDAGAAPERDQHCVRVQHRMHNGRDLVLVGGRHDDIGQASELAATLADEVAQALAPRVHHAVQFAD